MYRLLNPALQPLKVDIDGLMLDDRGSWSMTLDNGASVELGGGTAEDVNQRLQRFVRTVPQITSHYQRTAEAVESADLRYEDGYALRLKGVTTGSTPPATPARPRR